VASPFFENKKTVLVIPNDKKVYTTLVSHKNNPLTSVYSSQDSLLLLLLPLLLSTLRRCRTAGTD